MTDPANALAAFQGGKFAGCALADLDDEALLDLRAWTFSGSLQRLALDILNERGRKRKRTHRAGGLREIRLGDKPKGGNLCQRFV
jgi:hypothetical protein